MVETDIKRDKYVSEYLKSSAYKVYSKIPSRVRPVIGTDDLYQDLYIDYLKRLKSYDSSREFYPWFHTVIKNLCIDKVTRVWDKYNIENKPYEFDVDVGRVFEDDGSFYLTLLDYETPEMLCVSFYEEQVMDEKVEVFVTDIKNLCRRFDVPFNKRNYASSFVKVLDKTLNKMKDDEFSKLPYDIQVRLAEYGEAMSDNNIQITATGKMRNLGIVPGIRECLEKGVVDFNEIKNVLKKKGLTQCDRSLSVLLWREKKKLGLPVGVRKKGISDWVEKAFDCGRGETTVAGMLALAEKCGINTTSSSIRTYVARYRRKYNLVRK